MRTILFYHKYDWTKNREIQLPDSEPEEMQSAAIFQLQILLPTMQEVGEYKDLYDFDIIARNICNLDVGAEIKLPMDVAFFAKRTDGEPQPNEVWETNSGGLALITHAPLQFFEINALTPQNPPFLPSIYSQRKIFMLWYDKADGWTVSEVQSRLKKRLDLTPVDFFKNPSVGRI